MPGLSSPLGAAADVSESIALAPGAQDPTPPLLSVAAAARRLGIDRDTLTAAIRAGQVPSVQLGKRHRVPRAFIDHLVR